MSKCWICGKEMEHTVGGCEHCPDCGVGYNDLVFRYKSNTESKIYEQGWVCPKCGAVMSPRERYCPFCSPAQKIEI